MGADDTQLCAELIRRRPVADVDALPREDGTGVEALLELHDAHPGLSITGEDRPLDGGRAAPTRQQREVDVDHRQLRRAHAA